METLEKYLRANKRRNVKQVVCYARKYCQVLQTGDAREISEMADNKRHHFMAAYSKANDCYQTWKKIVERHQLKWSSGNTDASGIRK